MNPPGNKAEALEAVTLALEAGQPVPEPAASWLADGIAWYLNTPGSTIDEALLLKPEPGGAHSTVWRESKYSQRNRLLHQLAESLAGVTWSSAQNIAAWLKALKAGEPLAPEPTGEQVAWLHTLDLLHCPCSVSRVWQILRDTADLHSRITPDYVRVDQDAVES